MKRSVALRNWNTGLMLVLAMNCALAQQPPYDYVVRSGDNVKYRQLYPGVTWSGNSVAWYYNPAGQPAAYSTASAVSAIAGAAAKWSAACGVTFKYMGESSTAPGANDGTSVIGWKAIGGGYAGLTFNGYTGSYFTDADVQLDPSQVPDVTVLDGVVTHEWGHVLGLSHSDIQKAAMAGPPNTQYNGPMYERTLEPDDVGGCVCLYGLPDGTHPGVLSVAPSGVNFDAQGTGSVSAAQRVTLSNNCTSPVTVKGITVTGADAAQFTHVDGCGAGSVIPGGQSCAVSVSFAPRQTGDFVAALSVASDARAGATTVGLTGSGLYTTPPPPPTSNVAEFYNTTLRHFFSTIYVTEAQAIDAGAEGPGWMRTGLTYPAWMDSAPSGAVPVCRFYGTPGVGPNSHFYTIVPAECAQVQKDPGWTLETTQAFYVVPPIGATCPGGTTPVYRAYNNRAAYNDSNHRYTADLAEFNNMLSIGWTGEGIAWCAPQ